MPRVPILFIRKYPAWHNLYALLRLMLRKTIISVTVRACCELWKIVRWSVFVNKCKITPPGCITASPQILFYFQGTHDEIIEKKKWSCNRISDDKKRTLAAKESPQIRREALSPHSDAEPSLVITIARREYHYSPWRSWRLRSLQRGSTKVLYEFFKVRGQDSDCSLILSRRGKSQFSDNSSGILKQRTAIKRRSTSV